MVLISMQKQWSSSSCLLYQSIYQVSENISDAESLLLVILFQWNLYLHIHHQPPIIASYF